MGKLLLLLMYVCRSILADKVCTVTASRRVDCFPEPNTNKKACVARGCCWNPIYDDKKKTPWCYFSKHDVCSTAVEHRTDCFPQPNANKRDCLRRGCCWLTPNSKDGRSKNGVPYCFHTRNTKCNFENKDRFDCFPEPGATEGDCHARGCCWKPSSNQNEPWCFYGNGNFGYQVCGGGNTSTGFTLDLCMKGAGGQFGKNVKKLKAEFRMESNTRLRVKIYDPNEKRYEVPIPTPDVKGKFGSEYEVSYTKFPFGFTVKRRKTGRVIFDTNVGGFVFSDQFLQISSLLPSPNIYGLGEHVLPLKLNTKWTKLTTFARDAATPEGGVNIYGTHPFYVNLEGDGYANGVLLFNSNAMDIILQPNPAITYRTIGGILDFYIFIGPAPADVVAEYTEIVGRPMMPPYWSLGFHLCKYGYKTIENMQMVRRRMAESKIPQDTQWNDIDYMQEHKDFTIDHKRFHDLPQFVDDLHKEGMHYVMITDPAIRSAKGYKPFDNGVRENVFIKDSAGEVLIGKVWPGETAFPDFYHPNISAYWFNEIKRFHGEVKFDGLWIDMNEPSNFGQGSVKGCEKNRYDQPPFLPGVLGGLLADKTICMNAQHYIGKHYDVHSLYGHSEAVETTRALEKHLGKRAFVVTRSSFSGTGKYAAHWLGDNHSTWKDLRYSVSGMLSMNIFGIPMVGADICGFIFDTNEELCSRWMQLGAFYPFSRNHNNLNTRDQDPAAFGELLIRASKQALTVRYTLLPYLYTLLYQAHTEGKTVARPLSFEFADSPLTYGVDSQFMWGSGLLISPVLTKGATYVDAYFPFGRWYDYYTGASLPKHGTVRLPAAFDKVNLHVRGGSVIPTQDPELTTTASRKNDFGLIVALAVFSTPSATGQLFIDDGESFIGENSYTLINFVCDQDSLRSRVLRKGFTPENHNLAHVKVYGFPYKPKRVVANGKDVMAEYNPQTKALLIAHLKLSLLEDITITWK